MNAQARVDSTAAVIGEWLNYINSDAYVNFITIRGVSKDEYDAIMKLIRQSLEEYQNAKYAESFRHADELDRVENYMEMNRIRLFLLTLNEIHLNKHFKARKWYYTSKNRMPATSFVRLENTVKALQLPYKIDNYRKIRAARLTALIVTGGVIGLIPTVFSE